ncbi:MAG: ABC transporter permease [Bacteroidales bacterium]|nr:ABC transporter permease [Bacteroidales bacterium]
MNNTILKPKHKHFLISAFCLMVGITAATMLFQWVLHELSYNRFVEDGDRVYRLVSVDKTTGTKYTGGVCQLRYDLPDAVPQVEECVSVITHYSNLNPNTVRDMERNESIEVKSLTTSDNFFKVFTFPVVEGEPYHILQPNEAAISKEMAQKLYDGSALGKPLAYSYMGQESVYTVALVVDVPSNTHLPFEVVVPLSSGELNLYRNITETQPIYVKLKDNALFSKAEMKRLANIQKEKYDKQAWLQFQPLYDIHLHTDFVDPTSVNNGNASYVWIIIVGILLIVAVTVVNCATLDVSYSVRQTKNRVVKRVFGCSEFRLFSGNMLETLLITLVAMGLSLLAVWLLLPAFQSWIGAPVQLRFDRYLLIFCLVLLVLLPLASSLFGQYCLRSVAFADVLKGKMRHLKGIRISNASSAFQVGISSLTAVFTLVILSQLSFMRHAEKGVDTSNVVSINSLITPCYKVASIRNELLKNPNIQSVGLCSGDFSQPNGFINEVEWEGQEEGNGAVFQSLITDGYFQEMVGMELLAGDYLSKDLNVDDYFEGKYTGQWEYVVNEAAAKAMGWSAEEAVGKALALPATSGRIVGVVKDFHFSVMRNTVAPLIMEYGPEALPNIVVKIAPENRQQTLAYIQETIRSINYTDVFSYSFLGEKELYREERQIGHLSLLYFLAAMLLSLFGFFGVISYHLNQESLNMAVRKVYGATTREVMAYYLKTKLRMYVLPILLGTILSFYYSMRWLQNFAYHISFPVVLVVALLSFFGAFLLLSLIISGVVESICNRRITKVLQKG